MGREGSPASICRFYPGGQAAASPWLGSQPERPDGVGSQAEACGRGGSLLGQLRSETRGVGEGWEARARLCSLTVPVLVSKRWSRRSKVEGGSEGKNDRDGWPPTPHQPLLLQRDPLESRPGWEQSAGAGSCF